MKTVRVAAVLILLAVAPALFAETRSAEDMAKECRVALDLTNGRVEKNFENTLFTGECIGYIQGCVGRVRSHEGQRGLVQDMRP
jgi:hypothetical protein